MAQEHIGIIVQKGNASLLKAVDETIVSLDKSGKLSAAYDKWFGSQSIYKFKRDFAVEPIAR